MADLDQRRREQVTGERGQDLTYLVSHQLLGCASKLQIICDIWNEPDLLSEQLQAKLLQVLCHEVKFLQRLGRDILQLDLTASVELPLDLKPVNLVELIEQMLPSFQLQGSDRRFENHYEADLPFVWGDAERVRDVLDNLISNALKYSAPFSPIIISTQGYDGQVRVSVANFGPMIPPADQERIFTKFYRGNGHAQAGYGLGLYLARRLIELHGGQLWVESSPVEVTTFYFTLLLAGQGQPVPPFPGNTDPLTRSVREGSVEVIELTT